MRPRAPIAFALGTIAVLTGCAAATPHPELYAARYTTGLVEVGRSATTKQRYGKTDAITIGDSARYTFEDGLAAVQVAALFNAVRVDVRNKTDHSIKVVWDEASFIDLDGRLSRVMHIGVKYADRNASQPPSVIPAHQHLADDVFPTDRVFFSEAYGRTPAGWHNGSLLRPISTVVTVQPGAPTPVVPDSFATAVRARIGKRFGILIPLEVEGAKHEYTFWFTVKDAAVVP
jgi:hypothetical protein